MITWRDLIVTNEGEEMGTLAELLRNAPANFDNATLDDDGAISDWQQYFISAPGEAPDWDTPRSAVDWTGFREALAAAGGREDEG